MKIVIIGNGIAGITTANELRKLEPDAEKLEITIVTEEEYHYYARIRLPEILEKNLKIDAIQLYTEEWYAKKNIDVQLKARAISINSNSKTIYFEDSSPIQYDILVLSLGAKANHPNFEGSTLPFVFTLRTYEDARKIRHHIDSHKGSACVIGGGLLGLEAARHMALGGALNVSVLEICDRLLPKQLDEEASKLLVSYCESQGLTIHLDAKVSSIEADGTIILQNSKSLKTETVIVSAGITPNISLAQKSALSTNRGIIVNEKMQTSCPSIYAVGDCAEFNGISYGIIPQAMEMASVCAKAIMNVPDTAYKTVVPKTTLKIVGLDVLSAGIIEEADTDTVYYVRDKLMRYEKFILRENKLIGAILFGSKVNASWVQSHLGKSVTKEEIEIRLAM